MTFSISTLAVRFPRSWLAALWKDESWLSWLRWPLIRKRSVGVGQRALGWPWKLQRLKWNENNESVPSPGYCANFLGYCHCAQLLLLILPAIFHLMMLAVRNFPGTRFGSWGDYQLDVWSSERRSYSSPKSSQSPNMANKIQHGESFFKDPY